MTYRKHNQKNKDTNRATCVKCGARRYTVYLDSTTNQYDIPVDDGGFWNLPKYQKPIYHFCASGCL